MDLSESQWGIAITKAPNDIYWLPMDAFFTSYGMICIQ